MEKQIQRMGQGKRRHVYLSAELDAVMDELRPKHSKRSPWVESALWDALVAEYGEVTVLDAVEAAQADLDDDEILPEGRRTELELTG